MHNVDSEAEHLLIKKQIETPNIKEILIRILLTIRSLIENWSLGGPGTHSGFLEAREVSNSFQQSLFSVKEIAEFLSGDSV